MLGTEHICPAALMGKWTHASWPQLWAALLPFTRQASVSQALARLTELLYWIINCLIRETHFKSLLHWFISRLWCSQHYCAPFFPKALHLRGAFLYCWIPFPCPGHCSLEWAGQGGGCSQAAAAQGKQPHNYILYKPFIWNANYT